MQLVIQSAFQQIEMYRQILDNGVLIEITDFAYPGNYGLEGEKLVESWKSSDYRNQIVGIHGSYYDLLYHSLDPQIAEVTRKRYLWNLHIADQLDAEYTIFHTNYQLERHSKPYFQRWIQDHHEFLRKFSDQFETQIVVENMRDQDPTLLDIFQKTEKTTRPRFCLDIGHIQLYSDTLIETWFDKLGENTVVIHMKEQPRYGEELPLGTTDLDWKKIFDYINRYCDNPYVVLEMDGVEKIEQSMAYLRELQLL